MSKRPVFCASVGRVTQTKLRAELEAANVPLGAGTFLEPLNCYYTGEQFVVIIQADSDRWDAAARSVVAAHVPDAQETGKQRRKRRVRELLAAKEELIVLLTATNRELFESLREVRAAMNHMRQQLIQAGLPLTNQPLPNRTWEQAMASVLSRADAAVDSEV